MRTRDGIAKTKRGKFKLRIQLNGREVKRTLATREQAEALRDTLQGRAALRSFGISLPDRLNRSPKCSADSATA